MGLIEGGQPPPEKESIERKAWFSTWRERKQHRVDPAGHHFLNPLPGNSPVQSTNTVDRSVRTPDVDTLKKAVDEHPGLKWDERLLKCVEQVGEAKQDDTNDGTTQVKFPSPVGLLVWLPTNILTDVDEDKK